MCALTTGSTLSLLIVVHAARVTRWSTDIVTIPVFFIGWTGSDCTSTWCTDAIVVSSEARHTFTRRMTDKIGSILDAVCSNFTSVPVANFPAVLTSPPHFILAWALERLALDGGNTRSVGISEETWLTITSYRKT